MPSRKKDDSAARMVTRPAGPRPRTPEREELVARLTAMKDEDLDTSDIPEITEQQWTRARLFREPTDS